MRKLLTLPSLVLSATMLLAVPAFAQDRPATDDETPEAIVFTTDQPHRWAQEGSTATQVAADTDDEIVLACLRLPTLADLSKERWNEVHRRFDGRRGRPIKTA
ncbi:MAG: hypothetical protein JWR84_1089 [Caulobacter sp.]|nr:hypothetical protein [Caulobacter sp.]